MTEDPGGFRAAIVVIYGDLPIFPGLSMPDPVIVIESIILFYNVQVIKPLLVILIKNVNGMRLWLWTILC